MCELFGFCSSKKIGISFALKTFYKRGEYEQHGWGIAFYPDESAMIIKEPKKSTESSLVKFVSNYKEIQSKIFICHLRDATCGNILFKNTHPFQRELNGENWVFAHNGDIPKAKELKLKYFFPIGTTDSEYAFCYILDRIKEAKGRETKEVIEESAIELSKIGELNFLLSNGKKLYAFYTDKVKTLYYLLSEHGEKEKAIDAREFTIYLPQKTEKDRLVFISTEKITNENWIPFQSSHLYEFADGQMIDSHR